MEAEELGGGPAASGGGSAPGGGGGRGEAPHPEKRPPGGGRAPPGGWAGWGGGGEGVPGEGGGGAGWGSGGGGRARRSGVGGRSSAAPSQRKRPAWGRACPTGALGGRGGGATGGWGGRVLPLSARPGREWALLGRFGAAHQRVHRYLPTSLHNQEHGRRQCRYENPAQRMVSEQAGSGLKSSAINDLPPP